SVTKTSALLVPTASTPTSWTVLPDAAVAHSTRKGLAAPLTAPSAVVPLKERVDVPFVWLPHAIVPFTDEIAPSVPGFDPGVLAVVSVRVASTFAPLAPSKLFTPVPSNDRARNVVPEPDDTVTEMVPGPTLMLKAAVGS